MATRWPRFSGQTWSRQWPRCHLRTPRSCNSSASGWIPSQAMSARSTTPRRGRCFTRTCSLSARITTSSRGSTSGLRRNGITSGRRRPTSASSSTRSRSWRPPTARWRRWSRRGRARATIPMAARFRAPAERRWCFQKMAMAGCVCIRTCRSIAGCRRQAMPIGR